MRYWVIIMVGLLLAACQSAPATEAPLPTLAQPEAVATDLALTRNAPPPGFSTVAFPRIDDKLTRLAGWRYEMTFAFDGVFAQTARTAKTHTTATVSYQQLGNARRVVATIDDDLTKESEPRRLEGVRLGDDTYLVRDGICLTNAGDSADVIADLSAGDLLGGVSVAETAAQIATINGEKVWRYGFTTDALIFPSVGFTDSSRILDVQREMWVSPKHDAVVRYYVTAEVENIRLAGAELPVTGTLILRYDLFDVGLVPNINIPFGC